MKTKLATSLNSTFFNLAGNMQTVQAEIDPDTFEQGKLAYQSLTAYLKKNVKEELLSKLQELKEDQTGYELLAKKINQGDWQKLFSECDMELFPLHALRCLKDGLISSMTFSTSQLFYNVWTDEENIKEKEMPMRFIQVLSKNRKRIGLAEAMIDATMKTIPTPQKLRTVAKLQLLKEISNPEEAIQQEIALTSLKVQFESVPKNGDKKNGPRNKKNYFILGY
ncbi:MAG: hypothetical protein H0U73_04655 [Tatlockia sp.]|nr:hypothetical protein [Tatlockia sp.]